MRNEELGIRNSEFGMLTAFPWRWVGGMELKTQNSKLKTNHTVLGLHSSPSPRTKDPS